jgi:hypothetical protein
MFRNLRLKKWNKETVASYLGMLSHGNGWKLEEKIKAVLYSTNAKGF